MYQWLSVFRVVGRHDYKGIGEGCFCVWGSVLCMAGMQLFCILAVVFLIQNLYIVKTYTSVHQKQTQFLLYVNIVVK